MARVLFPGDMGTWSFWQNEFKRLRKYQKNNDLQTWELDFKNWPLETVKDVQECQKQYGASGGDADFRKETRSTFPNRSFSPKLYLPRINTCQHVKDWSPPEGKAMLHSFMTTALDHDLEKLKTRALDRAEWAEDALRRYHAVVPKLSESATCASQQLLQVFLDGQDFLIFNKEKSNAPHGVAP